MNESTIYAFGFTTIPGDHSPKEMLEVFNQLYEVLVKHNLEPIATFVTIPVTKPVKEITDVKE